MSCGLHDSRGNSAQPVLAELKGLAAFGGCASFAWRTKREGLGASGTNYHNVNWPSLVVHVGEDQVSTLVVAVVRRNELFSMDRPIPPCVEDFMKGVGNSLVSFDRPAP